MASGLAAAHVGESTTAGITNAEDLLAAGNIGRCELVRETRVRTATIFSASATAWSASDHDDGAISP